MNVRELVNEAFQIGNIVSADLQTLTGSQLATGVKLLNYILGEKSAKYPQIPYIGRTSIAGIVGQEEYFVANLVDLEVLTVVRNNVRYPMSPISREKYLGNFRVNTTKSLPGRYYAERGLESGTPGMKLFVWYKPSTDDYSFEVTGKFTLSNVTADTEISDNLESYYISYLTYELAKRLCSRYKAPFSEQDKEILTELRQSLTNANQFDPAMTYFNGFPASSAQLWAQANFQNEYDA